LSIFKKQSAHLCLAVAVLYDALKGKGWTHQFPAYDCSFTKVSFSKFT